jgi:DGQHR domain-containing protein
MARGSMNPNLEPTSPIDAIFGAYDIGRFRVPYLSSVLTVQQCADYLSLAGDDPSFTLSNGKVEELFQRDIDDERVVEMARNFLNPDAAQRPAFFNSLTVALLVKANEGFDAPPKNPNDNNEFSRSFGPVRISWERDAQNLPALGSFGCLYWNKLGVHAVAIDGQHRLAALKRLGKSSGAKTKQLGVSIIFLVLDASFGLKADEKRPVELMRQLFIDLNKHARKVSRSRELLLDDLDPLAVALRRSIGKELNFEPGEAANDFPIGKDGEFYDRLPLELVDWNGSQVAKVDTGPYATSILAFEWGLAALCKSKRFDRKPLVPSMFYDEDSDAASPENDERDYYARVKPLLRGWLQDIPELEEKFCQAERDQVPFALDAGSVRKMGECIHAQWGPAVTHLLTNAGPYRRLAEERHRRNTLNARFGTWFQAKAALDRAKPNVPAALTERLQSIKSELSSQDGPAVVDFQECVRFIETEIKHVSLPDTDPEPHLLFFLTGQRSMILALRLMFDAGVDQAASASKLCAELGWAAPKTRGEEALVFARILAEAISHWNMTDGGIVFTKACTCGKAAGDIPRALWRGSILKRESATSIDFSGIAAERGARMLYLLAACWLHKKTGGGTPVKHVRAWCKSGRASELEFAQSASGRHLKKALLNVAGFDEFSRGSEANKFPMAFLAKMKLTDGEPTTEADLKSLVQSRFEWLWDRAGGDA